MSGSAIVNDIIMDTLWTLGLIGLGLAVAAGLFLVLAPGSALAFAARMNREYSVNWLQRLIDAPRQSEPFIYRHHTVIGSLLVLATAYFFWQFFTAYDTRALAALFAGTAPPVVLEILALTFTAVLVLGNAVGLVLGFVILIRPSLLKGTEGWANRWVASDRAVDKLDRPIGGPENLTHRYPRRVGLLILFAVVYILLIAAIVLK